MRDKMDIPLLSHELAEAVTQMSPGRAPGFDGLPVEFSKRFWGIIGQDLFCMLCECVGVGELPMSCLRAALTLPKKGTCVNLRTGGLWHYSVRTTRYLPRSSLTD
ncbi:unnamed protein product [Oncorhynchus mykiss]|uniref:Reverse transcriptase domain-containing protein n=1 Tax=Oncorhynchus mykiss TaxID=8022 RepID=A0A060ZBB7_ONCMY|nr:unnamed protein product [Oncorhynchus mykiss]